MSSIFSEKIEEHATMRSHITPPWLWIGVQLKNGDILDKTEEVQRLLDMGVPVTHETIDNSSDIKRYFYLDTKTLNEEEFPPEGVVINDTRN